MSLFFSHLLEYIFRFNVRSAIIGLKFNMLLFIFSLNQFFKVFKGQIFSIFFGFLSPTKAGPLGGLCWKPFVAYGVSHSGWWKQEWVLFLCEFWIIFYSVVPSNCSFPGTTFWSCTLHTIEWYSKTQQKFLWRFLKLFLLKDFSSWYSVPTNSSCFSLLELWCMSHTIH